MSFFVQKLLCFMRSHYYLLFLVPILVMSSSESVLHTNEFTTVLDFIFLQIQHIWSYIELFDIFYRVINMKSVCIIHVAIHFKPSPFVNETCLFSNVYFLTSLSKSQVSTGVWTFVWVFSSVLMISVLLCHFY